MMKECICKNLSNVFMRFQSTNDVPSSPDRLSCDMVLNIEDAIATCARGGSKETTHAYSRPKVGFWCFYQCHDYHPIIDNSVSLLNILIFGHI
jgi:hypothetical protein